MTIDSDGAFPNYENDTVSDFVDQSPAATDGQIVVIGMDQRAVDAPGDRQRPPPSAAPSSARAKPGARSSHRILWKWKKGNQSMKRSILILFLVVALLTGTASAVCIPTVRFGSADFDGGMISGIWQNGSSLYAADSQNKVVWCIKNGKPEVFAGDRTYRDINGIVIADYFDAKADKARFMEPWAIVPFLNGWAVSDAGANTVRYIVNGSVMTACGGKKGFSDGFCTEARFSHPTGLAVDNKGLVYIADTGNGAIRTLDTRGNVRTVYTGLAEPTGLCWHDGALYIAETGRSRILCLKAGALTVLAGDSGAKDNNGVYGCGFADGPAASALFEHPQGLAVGDDGAIYIADTGNGAIRRLMDGRVSTMAVTAEDDLYLASPQGILVSGRNILVSDSLTGAILEFDTRIHEFQDVSAADWFAPYVREALIRGIISGEDNSFRPNDPVTRADFAEMLANLQRCLDGSTIINGESKFTDITDETPNAAFARWSGDLGIIGKDTGEFAGDEPIRQQEMVEMLYRFVTASEMDNVPAGGLDSFSGSFPDGTPAPSGTAARAQAVKLIVCFMDMYGF